MFLTAWSPIVSYNQIITGTLSESVEKYYFQRLLNEWSSKNLWKMISADVKANIKQQEIKQAVFNIGDHFWAQQNRHPKNSKKFFFQHKFYSLKAHAHYFNALIYLTTWRASKIGIFTHFTSINLPLCSPGINSLMYVYYTDPQLLLLSPWSQCRLRHCLIAILGIKKKNYYPWFYPSWYCLLRKEGWGFA